MADISAGDVTNTADNVKGNITGSVNAATNAFNTANTVGKQVQNFTDGKVDVANLAKDKVNNLIDTQVDAQVNKLLPKDLGLGTYEEDLRATNKFIKEQMKALDAATSKGADSAEKAAKATVDAAKQVADSVAFLYDTASKALEQILKSDPTAKLET